MHWLILATLLACDIEIDAAVRLAVGKANAISPASEPAPAAKPEPKFESVRLLLVYDKSDACKRQLATMKELEKLGYDVAYASVARPGNEAHVKRLGIASPPSYVIGRGHRAVATWSGERTAKELADWYWAVHEGREFAGPSPAKMQDMLGASDRPYLERRVGPSSCWMLNCPLHSPVFIDIVDDAPRERPFHYERRCDGGVCTVVKVYDD